jgi:hypothetical protein
MSPAADARVLVVEDEPNIVDVVSTTRSPRRRTQRWMWRRSPLMPSTTRG